MKYNVYLLSFNNYYNRRVLKGYDTIAGYVNAGHQIGQTIQNCNFEMRDGITSEIIINQGFATTQPDYMLIEEKETNNFSRWFILDSDLIRGNQYKFTLKRDICVDYNDVLINSHYFIERGWINDKNSDLLYNKEGQAYSQIKTGQTYLFDETNCAWIVGYFDKKWNGGSMGSHVNIGSEVTYTAPNGISNWTVGGTNMYQYIDMEGHRTHSYINADTGPDNYYMCLNMPVHNINLSGSDKYNMVHFGIDLKTLTATNSVIDSDWIDSRPYTGVGVKSINSFTYVSKVDQTKWTGNSNVTSASYKNTLYYNYLNYLLDPNPLIYSNLMNDLNTAAGLTAADKELAETLYYDYNGKTIKDLTTNKVYRISVMINFADGQFSNYTTSDDIYTSGKAFIKSSLHTAYGDFSVTFDDNDTDTSKFDLYYHYNKYYIRLTEEVPVTLSIQSASTRQHTLDAAYDMFCLPYGDLTIKYTDGGQTKFLTMTKELSMNLAQSIAINAGENIYDLQILPYCPMRECIIQTSPGFSFDIRGLNSGQYDTVVDQSAGAIKMGFILYPSNAEQSSFKLRDCYADCYTVPQFTDAYSLKKDYNTKMYRLSSPNFASSFEFSMAMNDGIEYYIVSYTYKPYTPYIRIRPKFNRMYNQDYQDGRGLILQGDFSVPTLTDQWVKFEIENKNYLNTFNREIDSMELQHKVGETQDLANAITGSITGALSGAMAGGIAGSAAGPVGTAVGAIGGAVIGGVTSAVGGVIDYQNNQKLRNDAIDKAKDLFNYQLDNIKALPRTIRNIGCFTADFTMVPVLEEYSASPDEIDTYDYKMNWYGMSIMRPGHLLEYTRNDGETFVQGYLLRLDTASTPEEADNHLAEALSDEVSKGLYIS
ncbi:MAG: hypothetical protein J6Y28_08695 [Acholeplasmatales bacterium]|nr:hypothetical protein [Acholeplasmatales bacterium]